MTWNSEALPRFIKFAIQHKESGDIDPVYPVLRHVQRMREASRLEAIWHTLLYLAWYHLGSAEAMLLRFPLPMQIEPGRWTGPSLEPLPTGVERRGFRGHEGFYKAIQMLNWFVETRSPLPQWLDEVTSMKGTMGWTALYQDILQAPHCGSWAAFKWCDLARNVLGCNITSPDIGLGGGGKNAGPVPGLELLTRQSWYECSVNQDLQIHFYLSCRALQVPWEGLEEMETALCDFNSVVHGRYYVGHDIDKQMEDIADLGKAYWDARLESFPRAYLGELQGWTGVRKELKGTIHGERVKL